MTKTPPSNFKVTISKNPLLSRQAVISKGISVPSTNLGKFGGKGIQIH